VTENESGQATNEELEAEGNSNSQFMDDSSEDVSEECDAEINMRVEVPELESIDENTPNPYFQMFDTILEKYRTRFERFGARLESLKLENMNGRCASMNSGHVKKHVRSLERILKYF
jgi:hypothetical protein